MAEKVKAVARPRPRARLGSRAKVSVEVGLTLRPESYTSLSVRLGAEDYLEEGEDGDRAVARLRAFLLRHVEESIDAAAEKYAAAKQAIKRRRTT